MTIRRAWLLVVLALALPSRGEAQRREGKPAEEAPVAVLPFAVSIGEVMVPKGRYYVTLSDDALIFARERTRVIAARVPVVVEELEESDTKLELKVTAYSKSIAVDFISRKKRVKVTGTRVAVKPPKKSLVLLAGKTAHGVEGGIPEKESELALIGNALVRYEKDVAHCGDNAHRQRWTTDHPRFVRCVCPMTTKWRLPKVVEPTRVHRVLAKRRNGYSITVTPEGKVAECRVWTGSHSPEQKPKKTEAAQTTAGDSP